MKPNVNQMLYSSQIFLKFIYSPEDFGNHQVACVRPRYRRDPEVKTPSSGQMLLPITAFKKAWDVAPGPEVFDADRDCVVP